MNFKILLKQLIPPALVNLWKKRELYLGYYWRGVYSQLNQVPASGTEYNSNQLITFMRNFTERFQTAARSCGTIPPFLGDHTLLAMLAGVIGAHHESISILDFGGSMGIGFISVSTSLPGHWDISYHLVESQRVCETGETLWSGDDRIFFHSSLPKNLQVDIVYSRATLQYIEDYPGLLRQLAGYKAMFLLLADLPAGDIPTYATAQHNLKKSILPYWFFNFQEIIDIMAQQGYSLIFKGGQEKKYDRSNFPKSHRLEQMCNLLFTQSLLT
jgi:putative methyltransferase (TIGR04325 family)